MIEIEKRIRRAHNAIESQLPVDFTDEQSETILAELTGLVAFCITEATKLTTKLIEEGEKEIGTS